MSRHSAFPSFLVFSVLTLALIGCPLPFEFTPAGATGAVASTSDPANPSVTAQPTFDVVQTSTGSTLDASGQSIVSNRNVRIRLESET
ncbi:MAG: hypothetical protein EA382_01610, partial [Spirochaetaceae bacterium]